ncbi:WecB/TagA/CpsF family glycosyltransferase [Candidatus Gracilibacteria bacterium]|nr:WecB/TagA/CpsF family glycosyltransferase [Candidatus Gracilibacteria bacterium]
MQVFGIKIDKLKYNELFEKIIKLETQNIVFTPNPEILLKTIKDKEFENLIKQANYNTSDGIGLYIAYQIIDNNYNKFINILLLPYFFFNLFFRRKFLYEKYGERICGSDLTKDLVQYSEKNNIKITIIDLYNPTDSKKVESQKMFSKLLKDKFKNLNFDYFIYEPSKKGEIIEYIKNSDSKIIFSTLGMKRQEESIIEIMQACKNIKIGLGIGSSFDYFIGFQKRAPKIWRSLGIEWLYRLLTGPRKIDRFKRLYNAIFVFIFYVIKYKK